MHRKLFSVATLQKKCLGKLQTSYEHLTENNSTLGIYKSLLAALHQREGLPLLCNET